MKGWLLSLIIYITLFVVITFLIIVGWLIYYLMLITGSVDIFFTMIPSTLQKVLWSASTSFINATSTPFAIVTVFLLIMYIIWLIIILFIPEYLYPFPIPIRKILLDIPPLPDLDNAGFFRLFDRIIEIFTTRQSILHALGFTVETVGVFLNDATKFLIKNEYPDYDPDKLKEYLDKQSYDYNSKDRNKEDDDDNSKNMRKSLKSDALINANNVIDNEKDFFIAKDTMPIYYSDSYFDKIQKNIINGAVATKYNVKSAESKFKANSIV